MEINIETDVFWGFLLFSPSQTVAHIEVLGIRHENTYYKLSRQDIINNFTPHGKVVYFYPTNIVDKSFCDFKVRLDDKAKENENYDDYLVSGQAKYLHFSKLIYIEALPPFNSLSLEYLNTISEKQELTEGQYYIKIKNNNSLVGPFVKDRNTFRPKTGKEVDEYEIINNETFNSLVYPYAGDNYLLFTSTDNDFLLPHGQIDCMSKEQLQEWFKDKIKDAKLLTDLEKTNIKKLLDNGRKLFISNDLDSGRFKRAEECFEQFKFSNEELIDLCNDTSSHIFQKLQKQLSQMKADIKSDIESKILLENNNIIKETAELKAKKESIEEEIEKNISEIDKTIKEFELRKTSAENDYDAIIKELESKRETVEKNYEMILSTLKIAAQVNNSGENHNVTFVIPVPYTVPQNGKSFPELKEDDYTITDIIKRNLQKYNYDEEKVVKKLIDTNSPIFAKPAVIIPCISWAFIFAQAIGNSKVYVMHVEHDWLHYADFCNHGLLDIWKQAQEDVVVNYILVLQDLNLTQPECGCKPLFDLISGYRPSLEGTEYGIPKNLKIFATLIPFYEEKPIGLKLSKDLFSGWADFGEKNDMQFLQNKTIDTFGYCLLTDLPDYKNNYEIGDAYFDQ